MFLKMEHIYKNYGDILANKDVDLDLKKGEILALVGENGAGKSTLMKVLYGLEEATSGKIFLNGEEVYINGPSSAIKLGIGMVQQHFMLFNSFTVTENIVYGREPKGKLFFDMAKARQDVIDLGKKYDLPLDPDAVIEGMPVGLRQRVEILKVLYQNTDIIIFDEPTAVLTPQEVTELLKTMKNLSKMGKSIILITHKLNEVMEVADRTLVMRSGEKVGELMIKDTNIKELSYLMVGRHIVDKQVEKVETGETVFESIDLTLTDNKVSVLDNVNIHVKRGEIVGIAGVSGNGQTELVETIFGLKNCTSGKVIVNGEDVTNTSVMNVRNKGVALVPEDRNVHGSAALGTLTENSIMGFYHKDEFSKNGIIDYKVASQFTDELIEEFKVVAKNNKQTMSSLSGGNSQKLIIAREISQHSSFLIVSEPTRGVDIGAMEFIHNKLFEKRANKDGILLISSELTEILKLSDRVYVMYEGEVKGEFTRETANEEEIGFLMLGGNKDEV
ncbi:ABC transporter ATP-binding protein [Mycoplasmatota bacterium]|nr:ABC transporter ATP-binding protein [Mycoplasmatota bacterium]